jgi:FkbM family methyltransferase
VQGSGDEMSAIRQAVRRLAGKRIIDQWCLFRSRTKWFRWFRNWRQIAEAEECGKTLPPLLLRGGLQICHGKGDSPLYIFNEVFVEQCYTKSGFYHPKSGDTVLDLGANIGLFALFLQWKARDTRVHCFEPAVETRGRLQQNVRANGLEKCVSVYPFAVSDHSHVSYLKQARKTGVRSLFENNHYNGAGEEAVNCVSLNQVLALCGVGQVDFLKVDVEGAEIEVFEGAQSDTLDRIRRVALEFHDAFRPGCCERVTKILSANGFRFLEVDYQRGYRDRGVIRASRA